MDASNSLTIFVRFSNNNVGNANFKQITYIQLDIDGINMYFNIIWLLIIG